MGLPRFLFLGIEKFESVTRKNNLRLDSAVVTRSKMEGGVSPKMTLILGLALCKAKVF